MNYSIYSILKLLIRASLLGALLSASLAMGADFGVAQWGMTIDQVKNLETRSNLTPFGETNYLIYKVDLSGIQKTRIIYQFSNGQLSQGRFLFSANNPMDTQTYLSQYQQVNAMMTDQYGPPNNEELLTPDSDAMTILAPENYANELASDRLILKASWRSSTATINHQLAWNQSKPHHQLVYNPINVSTMTQSVDAF